MGWGGALMGAVLAALAVGPAVRPAWGMQFEVVPRDDGDYGIVGQGPVVGGDMARLSAAVRSRPSGSRLIILVLDSPGGDVDEGLSMADAIHRAAVPVAVPSGAKCASICFLMFAASPQRYAAQDALIGVHSATQRAGETVAAKARTTELARIAAEYGVPADIVGMMVQARPRQMEWLTPEALAGMDVRLWETSAAASVGPPGMPAPVPPPSLPPPPGPSPGPSPSPSVGPGRPAAVQPAGSSPGAGFAPLAGAGPVFSGALFCRGGVRQLQLEFAEARDQATLSFSPGPASRGGSSGSLRVEGRLDPVSVTVRPTGWVSRVGESAMVGLTGRSEDGGQTYRGQAVAGVDCSSFTMKRTR